ncbi:hypothetical protein ACFWXA_29385 [Streptomyces atroolivaceus]|uniref:hypothetical protein n=1 Tax=Streptomyces atroolivaceus TaxID=66869 RepID=UPI0036675C37
MQARKRLSVATIAVGCAALLATAAPADAGPSAAQAAPVDFVQAFTQPGEHIFTAPKGSKTVMIAIVGAGGGGGGGGDAVGSAAGTGKGAGGGGGGGGSVLLCGGSFRAGDKVKFIVGAGGKGRYGDGVDGHNTEVRMSNGLLIGRATGGGRATEAQKGVYIGYGGAGGAETSCFLKPLQGPVKRQGNRGGNGSGPGSPGNGYGGSGGAPGGQLKACPQAGFGGGGGTGGYSGRNVNSRGQDGSDGKPGCVVVLINAKSTTVDDLFVSEEAAPAEPDWQHEDGPALEPLDEKSANSEDEV